jgi:hypothetical protein
VKALILAALLLCICACGSVSRLGAGPSPSPSPTALSRADLRYRLVDRVGAPFACSRTQGPIVRTEDPSEVVQMVAALRSQDPEEFDAIVRHEHLNATNLSPTDDQRVLDQASLLAAVQLTPRASAYDFSYELAGPPAVEVTGTISAAGDISVARRAPAQRHLCPL